MNDSFVQDFFKFCPASVICTAAISEENQFHFALLIKLTCSFGKGAPSASAITALLSGSRWAVITSSFVYLICSSLDVSSLPLHLFCSFLLPNINELKFKFYLSCTQSYTVSYAVKCLTYTLNTSPFLSMFHTTFPCLFLISTFVFPPYSIFHTYKCPPVK